MAKRVRLLYKWSGGELGRVGAVPEARLRAWEYDVASADEVRADIDGMPDTVRLWRTRRPDLAPPELWVGDVELVLEP
ncbi:MAG TPA: hypothetical protein VEO54_10730 [Thermoanaerobaculia bacterium]|nr:hypothetical protein [Thermoanaerobaculia bacterium]